ncbi:unnamed protein product [Caenorhabditis nigoni]
MSQPVSSSQLVDNAVDIIINWGIQTVHPNFNSKCVLRANAGHVTVSVSVADIPDRSKMTSHKIKLYQPVLSPSPSCDSCRLKLCKIHV